MSFFLIITFSTIRRRLQEIKDAADKSDEINQKMIPNITTCQAFIDAKRQIIYDQLNYKINCFLEKKISTINFPDLSNKSLIFPLVDSHLNCIKLSVNVIMNEIEKFKETVTNEIMIKNGKPEFQKNIDDLFRELSRADEIRLFLCEFRSAIAEAQLQKNM